MTPSQLGGMLAVSLRVVVGTCGGLSVSLKGLRSLVALALVTVFLGVFSGLR